MRWHADEQRPPDSRLAMTSVSQPGKRAEAAAGSAYSDTLALVRILVQRSYEYEYQRGDDIPARVKSAREWRLFHRNTV